MTVLAAPRLFFTGQITWDPIVTNNHPRSYSETTSEPVLGGHTALQYRSAVVDSMVTDGNWNVDGTHRSVLFDTAVTGVDVGSGPTTADPVVGVPVDLGGMLVDADPYGGTSSQLFHDRFTVGIDGGCQAVVAGDGPFVARRITMGRNTGYRFVAGGASVVWQASAPAAIAAFDSPVLQRFAEELEADGALGLTVRFTTYRTVYYGVEAPGLPQMQALQARVRGGGFQPNPTRSLVVGVVGIWRKGEPVAEPGDRVLAPVGTRPLGTAFAQVDGSRLTLDLGNSMPERDFAGTKVDLGPLEVQASWPGGPVTLGTLQPADYARDAYRATAGIVTFDLDDALLGATAGALTVLAGGQPVLAEQELVAYPVQPNLYADEGDPATLVVQVLQRGRPPADPVLLRVVRPRQPPEPPVAPITVPARPDGTVRLPVDDPAGAWTWILRAFGPDDPVPGTGGLDTQRDGYATTRVLPQDARLDALPATWADVYREVLIFWKALAPCMDNWLDLADEDACARMAPLLRRLTSLDHHDRFRYMPVTRDLTRGQRDLLHRWCDVVTEGAAAAPAGRDVAGAVANAVDGADEDDAVTAGRLRRSSRGL